MLRASFALLLICASATALAQHGRGVQTNATNCQEIADKAVESQNSLPVESRPKATAIRNKYAQPTAAATAAPVRSRVGGGSGGDSDAAMPRSRGSKWHSFLPGMFR